MNQYDVLICPVCNAKKNNTGEDFASKWAVTMHIASCAKSSSDNFSRSLHKNWIKQYFEDIDFNQSNISLANEITLLVHKAMEEKRKPPHDNIGFAHLRKN